MALNGGSRMLMFSPMMGTSSSFRSIKCCSERAKLSFDRMGSFDGFRRCNGCGSGNCGEETSSSDKYVNRPPTWPGLLAICESCDIDCDLRGLPGKRLEFVEQFKSISSSTSSSESCHSILRRPICFTGVFGSAGTLKTLSDSLDMVSSNEIGWKK